MSGQFWRNPLTRKVLIGLVTITLGIFGWRYWSFHNHLSQAKTALNESRPADALTILQRLPASPEKYADLHFTLARTYRRLGQFEEMNQHLDYAAALDYPEEEIQLQQWLCAAQAGRVSQVETQLRRALSQGVSDDFALEIYEALAQGYQLSFQINELLVCLSFWLDWQPNSVPALLMRGQVQGNLKNLDEARKDLVKLLEIEPDHLTGRIELGNVLLQLNEVRQAQQEFEKAHEVDETSADASFGLAQCAHRLAKPKQAIEYLNAALETIENPILRGDCLELRGRLYLESRQVDAALEDLTAALVIHPYDHSTHQFLFQIYRQKKQTDLAAKHEALAVTLRKQNARLNEISETLVARPASAGLRLEAGQIWIERNSYSDALPWLRSAITHAPNLVPAHEALALCYENLGETDLAAKHRKLAEDARMEF